MIPYARENLINSKTDSVHFEGDVGELFDRFIRRRITDDFAVNEILRETETVFEEKLDDKDFPVGMWRGEFWGKLVISMCRVYHWKHDEKIREILTSTVDKILSYQEEDGYIGTYKNSRHIMHCDPLEGLRAVGFECEWNWNVWCRKYTLWAMLETYQILGDEKILTACRRFVDCLIDTLREKNVHICETGTFFGTPSGSILKPMLLLYRITGEKKYLDLALDIADSFENDEFHCMKLIKNSLSGLPAHLWGLEIPKNDNRKHELAGKIYETLSSFDGILELYRVTGDEKYLAATEKFVEVMIKYEYNTLFSIGFNDIFVMGASTQDAITEHCDVIHFMRLLYELFRLTGKVKYMHLFDLAFVNPYIAGITRDGTWGSRGIKTSGQHMYVRGQSGMKHSHCCVNNVPRGFVNAAESAVMKSGDKIYVNLYLPASAKVDMGTENVRIKISDGYMQHCKVTLDVAADVKSDKKLMIRIPDWSKKTSVTLDGKSFAAICGEYLELPLTNGVHKVDLAFDDTPVLLEPNFNRDFYLLSPHKKRRFYDACKFDHDCFTKTNMAIVRYGAVLLARASEDGYTAEELYSENTVYGKGYTVSLTPAQDDFFRCSYDVKLTNGDNEIKYRMHDFASAGDHLTDDGFSVFI